MICRRELTQQDVCLALRRTRRAILLPCHTLRMEKLPICHGVTLARSRYVRGMQLYEQMHPMQLRHVCAAGFSGPCSMMDEQLVFKPVTTGVIFTRAKIKRIFCIY